jgi:hypothetical protein
MTLLFSSFLFIISKFYISTITVKIQLNDNKFKNINLLFTTQYKLFTYQVMSYHIHDCYSVIEVQRQNKWSTNSSNRVLDRKPDRVTGYKVLIDLTSLILTLLYKLR